MVPGFSWSAPEQKPRPAPVITTTRTSLSVPMSRSASRNGIITSKAMAFMRSGRFNVTTATWGCGRVTSVKDMRGMVEGPVAGPDASVPGRSFRGVDAPGAGGVAGTGCGGDGAGIGSCWLGLPWCASLRAIQRRRAARASQS